MKSKSTQTLIKTASLSLRQTMLLLSSAGLVSTGQIASASPQEPLEQKNQASLQSTIDSTQENSRSLTQKSSPTSEKENRESIAKISTYTINVFAENMIN